MLHWPSFWENLPTLDLENGVWRAWWMEPLQATVCFGIFINWYWYHERQQGRSSNTTFRETVSLEWGPLFYSGALYWLGIFVWKCIVPPAALHIPDGVPQTWSDLLYLVAEVISGIVLYDAIFFFLHWAMHEIPALRSWHRRHHEMTGASSSSSSSSSFSSPNSHNHHSRHDHHHGHASRIEARDVLRHGVVDGTAQVLVNILVQRTTPWGIVKTRLARALHNVVVIWMLTESHTAASTPYIWRRWCVGVRNHVQHHSLSSSSSSSSSSLTQKNGHRWTRYQQFFGYLDDLRLLVVAQNWRHQPGRCGYMRSKTNEMQQNNLAAKTL